MGDWEDAWSKEILYSELIEAKEKLEKTIKIMEALIR